MCGESRTRNRIYDEIDKIARKRTIHQSRVTYLVKVQQALLKLLEGTVVNVAKGRSLIQTKICWGNTQNICLLLVLFDGIERIISNVWTVKQ
jgi:ATP-dependent protease Clp ATPase subunit